MACGENRLFEQLLKGEDVPCICCGNSSCQGTPGDIAREDSAIQSEQASHSPQKDTLKDQLFPGLLKDRPFSALFESKPFFRVNSEQIYRPLNGDIVRSSEERTSTKLISLKEWQDKHPGLSKSYIETLVKFDVIKTSLKIFQTPQTPLQRLRRNLSKQSSWKLSRRHTYNDVTNTSSSKLSSPNFGKRGCSQTPPKSRRRGIQHEMINSYSPTRWNPAVFKSPLVIARPARARVRRSVKKIMQVRSSYGRKRFKKVANCRLRARSL